jgi:hypothetical protein
MTDTPEWVAVSGVSPAAHSLHTKMLMLNEAGAAVTSDVLANLMGVTRGDKIAKYVAELVALGAVRVVKGGQGNRNRYRALADPPAGYAGPSNMDAWLAGEQGEVVYYAQRATDLAIKIGYTVSRISVRLRTLRQDFGQVDLLATEPGSADLETARQEQFFDWWIRPAPGEQRGKTEWFWPCRPLMAHIDSLVGAQ